MANLLLLLIAHVDHTTAKEIIYIIDEMRARKVQKMKNARAKLAKLLLNMQIFDAVVLIVVISLAHYWKTSQENCKFFA